MRYPLEQHSCLFVILAAGRGLRMQSDLPKALHAVGRLPLLGHVLRSTQKAAAVDKSSSLQGEHFTAVIAHPSDFDSFQKLGAQLEIPLCLIPQEERLGTGHALRCLPEELLQNHTDVIVVFGDTPLVLPETLSRVRYSLSQRAALCVVGFPAKNPQGYGRLIGVDEGWVGGICEDKHASPEIRSTNLCNAGIIGLRSDLLLNLLPQLTPNPLTGEIYLTELVALASVQGLRSALEWAEEDEVQGVNTRAQLAECERLFQSRCRDAALAQGVTLEMPETVFFSYDTQLEADVRVEPYVVFGPGVVVERGSIIRSFSNLEGSHVGAGSVVGPFARLRPGTKLAPAVRIGNFVEVKNSRLGSGTKANHLSYLGDAEIGAQVNIGAGTITCNYDGQNKYVTTLQDGAFIGAHTTLVAPVTVGQGAYIGSGSVIRQNVPAEALALTRAPYLEKKGWARQRIAPHSQSNASSE